MAYRKKASHAPEGVHLIFQPSHSPELQPAEHLWPFIREALANDWLVNLETLENILVERCRYLYTQPELMRSSTLFHWWKDIEEQTL
jgi:transposase